MASRDTTSGPVLRSWFGLQMAAVEYATKPEKMFDLVIRQFRPKVNILAYLYTKIN
jgi:hypothetical protein